ncbi:MAG: bacillithiol biosynthesis BshC, partial [Pyrinomonadaceae bacterium]|nr:bacillithiol biosynthesis BshC [Pyrinomonadaceae bacterium]
RDELLAGVIENFIANETAATFEESIEKIEAQLDELGREITRTAPTLAESLEKRRRKIIWHILTLRKKFHRAEIEKNDVLEIRMRFLINSLYPRNGLQERTLNIFHFLNRFGPNIIDWLYDSVESIEKEHKVIYL